jgi:two-component system NarL family sensor kinase
VSGQTGEDITTLIFVASAFIGILVLGIISFVLVHQRRMMQNRAEMIQKEKEHSERLLKSSLEIAEVERRKIAKDLHDEIGIHLQTLKMHLGKLPEVLDEPTQIALVLSYSEEMILKCIDASRNIHDNILPASLIKSGLSTALTVVVKQLNLTDELSVLYSGPKDAEVPLSKDESVQVYRLVKEILNNTVKHAKPARVEIKAEKTGHTFTVCILHDGTPVTNEQLKKMAVHSKGIGLKSIFTRTELMKAKLDFTLFHGKALVNLEVPLHNNATVQ